MSRPAPSAGPFALSRFALACLGLTVAAGCAGRRAARVEAQYAARSGQSGVGAPTSDAAKTTRAPVRVKAPLPDGWPREPIEPMPLQRTVRTVVDTHDPVARFVTDFQKPGALTVELSTRKAVGFKARVVLHDSFGTTLFEAPFEKTITIGPRPVIPGTLYLLVQRDGGVAEVAIRARFEAERYRGEE